MSHLDMPSERESHWPFVALIIALLFVVVAFVACDGSPTIVVVPAGGNGDTTQIVGDGNGTGNSTGNKFEAPTPTPTPTPSVR